MSEAGLVPPFHKGQPLNPKAELITSSHGSNGRRDRPKGFKAHKPLEVLAPQEHKPNLHDGNVSNYVGDDKWHHQWNMSQNLPKGGNPISGSFFQPTILKHLTLLKVLAGRAWICPRDNQGPANQKTGTRQRYTKPVKDQWDAPKNIKKKRFFDGKKRFFDGKKRSFKICNFCKIFANNANICNCCNNCNGCEHVQNVCEHFAKFVNRLQIV